jgi:hypothetical protein
MASDGAVEACLEQDPQRLAIGYLVCIALVFVLIWVSCLPTYLVCLDASIAFLTLAQICADHEIPYVKRTLINIIHPSDVHLYCVATCCEVYRDFLRFSLQSTHENSC